MNRIIGYILALIVLCGVAYAVYTFVPRGSQLPVTPAVTETDSTTGVETKTEIISDSTPTYRIEVRYPQFGIPAADAKVKEVVNKAVAAFKEYPANPPDSSVSQNELTGSFKSVYVGEDVVSVELALSEYTGGAHGNTVLIGVNVDRATGEELTLNDALSMIGKTLPEVAEISLQTLQDSLGDNMIFPDGASAKAENYSTFLVSEDKITFIFNNYQVAPYAAGQQYVWFKRVK